jgi:nitrogen fixation NifU-like protein
MASEFDELEEYVTDEMRSTYTDTVIDHAMNPRNAGSIPNADGFARVTGPCGDTMEIWLGVKDSRIRDATFWTDGCGTSIACGSMATEMITGKRTVDALRITQEDILNSLGGLPEESHHCALLAANTLKQAVRDHLRLKNEPWKRAYRNRG